MDTGQADPTFRLDPTPPFSFDHSLAFVDGFPPCAGDRVCRDGQLRTGGFAGSAPFVATLAVAEASTSPEGRDALRIEVRWPAERGDVAAVADALRAYLSLDDDLRPLYRAAADDPPFASVVDDLHGYHHVRFPTSFEAACWAALSQRTPWEVAKRQKRALVEAAGYVAAVHGESVACFPTPERVRRRADAVARAIDHERKRRTILEAAETFESEDLAALSDASLRERLAAIWGFGPWSSEFVTLRGFGRMSGLPRTERRLREAVAGLYDVDADATTDATLDRLSDPYDPQRGYWAHYIRVSAT